ncbi:multiple epidermal growth factor-like domains protein 6 [Saccostrea cucullata]|uniref:multiple epidermal growth factor-like domains protein 6 n=1 Tax=Saccostrea cuccullata TaxID=36930 RepID=UPI002ECFB6D9
MVVKFLLLVFIQYNWSRGQKGPCRDHNFGCCVGTKWDESQGKCTDCKLGYHGPNCKLVCEYPRFGMRCMAVCNCTNSSCNFRTGCPENGLYENVICLNVTGFQNPCPYEKSSVFLCIPQHFHSCLWYIFNMKEKGGEEKDINNIKTEVVHPYIL